MITGGSYIYAPAGASGVYALNKSNGNQGWHFTTATVNATPAYDSGYLYAGGANGYLYKIDVSSRQFGRQLQCRQRHQQVGAAGGHIRLRGDRRRAVAQGQHVQHDGCLGLALFGGLTGRHAAGVLDQPELHHLRHRRPVRARGERFQRVAEVARQAHQPDGRVSVRVQVRLARGGRAARSRVHPDEPGRQPDSGAAPAAGRTRSPTPISARISPRIRSGRTSGR